MPDHHEMLYLKLEGIMNRLRKVLAEDPEPDLLNNMAEEHQTLLKEIQRAGISSDLRMLERVKALNIQASEMINEIQYLRQKISVRIKKAADGKKLVKAYIA